MRRSGIGDGRLGTTDTETRERGFRGFYQRRLDEHRRSNHLPPPPANENSVPVAVRQEQPRPVQDTRVRQLSSDQELSSATGNNPPPFQSSIHNTNERSPSMAVQRNRNPKHVPRWPFIIIIRPGWPSWSRFLVNSKPVLYVDHPKAMRVDQKSALRRPVEPDNDYGMPMLDMPGPNYVLAEAKIHGGMPGADGDWRHI
jgi:hypothetical protein